MMKPSAFLILLIHLPLANDACAVDSGNRCPVFLRTVTCASGEPCADPIDQQPHLFSVETFGQGPISMEPLVQPSVFKNLGILKFLSNGKPLILRLYAMPTSLVNSTPPQSPIETIQNTVTLFQRIGFATDHRGFYIDDPSRHAPFLDLIPQEELSFGVASVEYPAPIWHLVNALSPIPEFLTRWDATTIQHVISQFFAFEFQVRRNHLDNLTPNFIILKDGTLVISQVENYFSSAKRTFSLKEFRRIVFASWQTSQEK